MSDTKSSAAPAPSGLAPQLVDLLVCPVTRGSLQYDSAKNCLISPQAKLAYPIRDGIPIMLEGEATPHED